MTRESDASREMVSALVDGELTIAEFTSTVDSVTKSPDGLTSWHAYHLVGDALRGSVHVAALDSHTFVARLRGSIEAVETGRRVPQPNGPDASSVVGDLAREGANDAAVRWKVLAGLASLATVATFGWQVASLSASGGAVAQNPAGVRAVTAADLPGGDNPAPVVLAAPAMLRDARLDELLAAHKQFGGTSALQMPAGFLRNATFDSSGK